MRYLLDTSAILAHYRQESGADAVQYIFEDREAEIMIAIGRQTPQRLPLIDALIAAAAQMQDATLVHRDQHLADIPDYIVRQRYLA